ncbi:MAG: DNA repair protein RecO [Myxococcales bacterium]
MRGPTHFTDALLLRSVDYRDVDRIVTLLTRDRGKAAYIARGARRSRKRFGASLQPFALLRAEVAEGRGHVGTLSQAQVTRAFPRLLGELERMGAGYAALELLRELLPEREPAPTLFDDAVAFMQELDAAEVKPGALLLCFQVRALSLAGFAPELDACGLCGKRPAPERAGLFDPRAGHLVCRACGGAPRKLAGVTRARLREATGEAWSQAAAAPWPDDELGGALSAIRAFAEHRLGKALSGASLAPGLRSVGAGPKSDSAEGREPAKPETEDGSQ